MKRLLIIISLYMLVVTANASIYIVKKGDSLSQISQMVTGTYKNYMIIAKKNNIVDPNLIFIDQELNIPDYLLIKKEIVPVTIDKAKKVEKKEVLANKEKINPVEDKFPKLEKKNLKDIADKIMDKIEDMRKQRRKDYLRRELIKDKVVANTSNDDNKNNIDVTDLENNKKDEQASLDDYIVKLNIKDPISKNKSDNHINRPEKAISKNIIKRRFSMELGSGFSHKPVSDAGSDILPGVAIRFNNTGVSCLGLRYSFFDSSKSKVKFEYDKLTAFYRYYPRSWESNNNSLFLEGGISYLDGDYTLVLSNKKMNDKITGFELSIGDEYYFTKNFSMEFKITNQIASADFTNSGTVFNESLNDTYFSTAANFYF